MNIRSLYVFLFLVLFILFLSPPRQLPSVSAAPSTFAAPTFFQLPGGIPDKSSPTLADLTGDGVPEILVGTTADNGETGQKDRPTVLVAMRGDGSVLWAKNPGAPINSHAAVGDINGDGQPEVVVGIGGDVVDTAHQGGVVAYDRLGNEIWRFTINDYFPKDGFAEGVYSSPTLCDVDSDGDMEITFGGWDQRIYMVDHLGKAIWVYVNGSGFFNADSIWSTAACADFNEDGNKEIVIGADITGGGFLPDGTATQNGGFLYIFDKNGNVLVRRFVMETIYSSPAVGDLDGDGDLEVVVGTGWYWWNERGRKDPALVHAFDTSNIFQTADYADPNKLPYLPGWPQTTPLPGYSSPALADLDNNGDLEIVIGTGDPFIANDDIPGAGSVYAWHHTGQVVSGWPIFPKNAGADDAPVFSSPTIADVDADGQLEVLFSMIWDVHIYNANGSFQERLPSYWTIWGSPAIGDADNDGKVDIWVGGSNAQPTADQSRGYMWKFEQESVGIGPQPWPQFHRDAFNSGFYSPALTLRGDEVNLPHQIGSGDTAGGSLRFRNTSGAPFTWTATASNSRVTVTPTSGTLAANSQATLSITVDTQGLSAGNYPLGNVTIIASAGGAEVDRAQVGVHLNLGELLYAPLLSTGSQSSVQADLIYWKPNNFALPSGQIQGSSPVAADLDGDGQDEVIFASSPYQCTQGACNKGAATLLMAARTDGSILWSQPTGGTVHSAPSVADINQDGSPEVVVAVGEDPYDEAQPGRVIVYNAQGTLLWEFRAQDRGGNGIPDGFFSSPTLCDLTNDRSLEVIFGGLDGYVYALNNQGQPLWMHDNGWEIRSTAACSDLNADGRKEVIIGAMSDPSGPAGRLYVFSDSGNVLARRALPEVVASSPAVDDLDGNGQKEIVVGSGNLQWSAKGTPPQMYVFSTAGLFSGLPADDSATLPDLAGWPQATEYPTTASPALGDIDGNGDLEIVMGTTHPTLPNDKVAGAGMVYAWHHTGQAVTGWPIHPANAYDDDGPLHASPIIADIDQDKKAEVIFTMLWDIHIYNADGTPQLYAARTGYTLSSSPVVADTDHDNKIEIWAGGSHFSDDTHGYLWRFESDAAGFGKLDWPMFRRNARNTAAP